MMILNSTFLRLIALAAVPALIGLGLYLAGFHVLGIILMVLVGIGVLMLVGTFLIVTGSYLILRAVDWLLGGSDHIPDPVHPVIQRVVVVHEHRNAE